MKFNKENKLNKDNKIKMNLQLLAGGDGAPEEGLTDTFINATTIDFVSSFNNEITKLMEILGVENRITVPEGTLIPTYTSKVTLAGGEVEPGAVIPLSEVKQEPGEPILLTWDKRRKSVPMEKIQLLGAQKAVISTDNALKRELQSNIKKRMFKQLDSATGAASGNGLQEGLANGWAQVAIAFEEEDIKSVAFVNPIDVGKYLGKNNISTQNKFGLKYLTDFLTMDSVIISTLVPAGTAYITAAKNLCLANAPMGSGNMGVFDMVTDETGIIGVTHNVDKIRLTVETITAAAIALFAERTDGIIKVDLSGGLGA